MKHVFISYRREDREYVATLASALEANDYRVWWDYDISGGASFEAEIKAGLDQAFAILIVVTPEGEDSKWMRREQLLAEELHLPVIPLVLRGKLWFRLNDVQAVDGRLSTPDDPVPDGLFATLLKYAPHELPDDIKEKVASSDQARRRLIPDLVELAERVNSPQGLAAREMLQQWTALPPENIARLARAAWEGLPTLPNADLSSIPQTPTAAGARLGGPRRSGLPVLTTIGVVTVSLILLLVVIALGSGLFGSASPTATAIAEIQTTAMPSSTPRIAPSVAPTASPKALLASKEEWSLYQEPTPQSTIKVAQSADFMEISFDLVAWGYTGISRQLPAQTLVGTTGIRFTYQGTGNPNTIEVKLIYPQGTVFGVILRHKTVTNGWVTYEIPYSQFECWPDTGTGQEKCPPTKALPLRPENVSVIDFAFSCKLRDTNNPNDTNPEDIPGVGTVLLKSVEATGQ